MDNKEILKKTITELLEKMNFKGEVFVEESKQDDTVVNIQTQEASFLIGQSGANLDALQHVARVLANKKSEQPPQFILDVNSYKKQRVDALKELAKNVAEQILVEKVAITLRPMSAFDRRVVHLALFENDQIKTESIGQEPERRVIVKPIK